MASEHHDTADHDGEAAERDRLAPQLDARWERPVVAATGGEATLLVRVVAPAEVAASRAAPLDVAFVLDRSGSMARGKLDLAKEGVDLAVSRLRDIDRTALVVYDDAVETVQALEPATPRLKASLRLALLGVDPRGSTFLSGGWLAGCTQLAEAPATTPGNGAGTRIRRVVLLTDGLANVGIVDPRQLAQHAGELRRRGITTTSLGVGQDFDEGLLSAMAEAGGGNFQYVADPQGLRAFFVHELQELFSVVATRLTVTLALPPGVQAALVSAFPVESREEGVDAAVGDLIAGDEIDLVFTLRVEPGEIGDRLPVGVSATWTDPAADARRGCDASPTPLRRSPDGEVLETEPDAVVAERAALQRAAAERRAGLELDRAGRIAESRQRMAQARYLLSAAPQTAAVQSDFDVTARLAEESPDASYGSHARKVAQQGEELRRRGRFGRRVGDGL